MTTTPEAYVHLGTDETTLTFYYDTLRADRNGITREIGAWTWNFGSSTVLTAVFDASFRDFRPTTTADLFHSIKSLKSIEGLEYLNTSQVTDMGGMFLGCESLAALDLSSFDTSKVTNMHCMFYGCKSLTTLDLSSLDTSQVTGMYSMFNDCQSLTEIRGLD
ncbi:MAG: BspA family leucine-rich repeat surface protein, partial [Porphyromonas sp.]|nr:BspA family leucine-rich repeat surface protein [Porphyromonas sp.]